MSTDQSEFVDYEEDMNMEDTGDYQDDYDDQEQKKNLEEAENELLNTSNVSLSNDTQGLNQLGSSDQIDELSIYVGQVEYEATPEELQAHFAQCGVINRVTIICDKKTGHSKGYGYIEFADKEAIEKALLLDNSVFKGRNLKVTPKRQNLPSFIRGVPPAGRGRGRGRGGYGRGRGYGTPYGYGAPYGYGVPPYQPQYVPPPAAASGTQNPNAASATSGTPAQTTGTEASSSNSLNSVDPNASLSTMAPPPYYYGAPMPGRYGGRGRGFPGRYNPVARGSGRFGGRGRGYAQGYYNQPY